MKDNYNKLLTKMREIKIIDQIGGILGWDTEVMMPRGGIEQRSNQQAYIARLSHAKLTDPEIGKLLSEIQQSSEFADATQIEKRNIELIQREYDRQTKLPSDFVAEFSKVRVIATEAWKEARKKNDFSHFKPHLEKVVEMSKQFAHYLNPDLPPYEVMLDYFEPGMTSERYTTIFEPLKAATIELIQKCRNAQEQPDETILSRSVPIEIQKKLAEDIIPRLGYNLEKGRLDVSAHPFTTGAYDDVRITTRYKEDEFASSFFAVMHESGHACYEQNLPLDLRYQPIGDFCSMGVHESQSRFYENILGRSKSFWYFYFPKFQEITGDIFKDTNYGTFIRAINRVKPSLIRVEADEVTYNLHIILRYELERDLFAGKVTVEELPQLWKDRMKEMLGVTVETDKDGVLQDIHWSGGAFGYFPTYSLGNIYGAQFFATLTEEIPNWNERLEKGELSTLTNWMKKNVQEKGNMFDPPELLKEVTGEYPNPKYLIEFLHNKYSELYGF
ncbi:MAG: carboxypeptidase M32 [Candidatus Heimdallarchaeaceae archaeon]